MSVDNVKTDDMLEGAPENTGIATPVASGPALPVLPGRLLAALRGHLLFCVVLLVAAALRLVVMLGYPPAMFYPDSYSYLNDAVTGVPDNVRGNGYPFFLRLLMPLHSFNLVSGLQALMGLAMGALIYAVLRRRGLPAWGATLCALPVLFDVYELQMEHLIASDLLFYTLVTVAVALLCFTDAPPWPVAAIAGLLTGYAATVRNVGEAMLVIVVAGMIARRMGWRRILAAAAAGIVPIAGYMIWYHSQTGQYAMNEAGPFLYARVQTFAECSRMNPPANLRVLCDPRPPAKREPSQGYLWAMDQPLMKLANTTDNQLEFTPRYSKLSKQFAERAIIAQPLSYAKAVARDTLTTFDWNRVNDNNGNGNLMGTGTLFQFEKHVGGIPPWITPGSPAARGATELGGANEGLPRVTRPWAPFLWLYQHVYLRGPVWLAMIVIGFAGVVLGMRRGAWKERRWGGTGLLPWMIGVSLVVLPPMTAGFSYRYILAAVPALSLAAGLAFAGRGGLATWLRSRRSKLQN